MDETEDRGLPRPAKWALKLLIIAAVLAAGWFAAQHYGLTRYLEYRRFTLPSDAMQPGLKFGDKFFADMGAIEPIHRGDVLVVHLGKEEWIKRVVALPGDRIALKDGVIWLNGEKVPQTDEGPSSYVDGYDGTTQKVTLQSEQLPGEAKPHRILDTGLMVSDDFREKEVPAGHYFFLGDNRDRSGDSRNPPGLGGGMGMVERKAIVGRLVED